MKMSFLTKEKRSKKEKMWKTRIILSELFPVSHIGFMMMMIIKLLI
jgi:hypothetical protein